MSKRWGHHFIFSGISSILNYFFREPPLDNSLFPPCRQLVQIKGECREQHLHINPENSCDPGMSGMEYILDNGIRPFIRSADPWNSGISKLVTDPDWITTNAALHCAVESIGSNTEIPPVHGRPLHLLPTSQPECRGLKQLSLREPGSQSTLVWSLYPE